MSDDGRVNVPDLELSTALSGKDLRAKNNNYKEDTTSKKKTNIQA